MRRISFVQNFAGWRKAARDALAAELDPRSIVWGERGDQPGLELFDEQETAPVVSANTSPVPRDFVEMARRVACHRSEQRWALLYRVLWRLTHGEPHLLRIEVDPDVHDLVAMDKAVRRDVHKMRAFVRFREVRREGAVWFVAWFEPAHHIVELNAPFFRDRFAGMNWSILTPDRCVHWDGSQLSFTAGVPRADAPVHDDAEALWLTYYGSIFNPARVKTRAMQSEMPKKYWRNLPETAILPELLREAPSRTAEMIARSRSKATPDEFHPAPVPDSTSLATLRKAALGCTACPLYRNATQTVFGEGPKHAPLMFVGEQPGDQEDVAGRPFVGPAGRLFDRALEDAGIDRPSAYVTNAVKHFKWEPRGKRRLHAKPNAREMTACRPWLLAELAAVRPVVLVLLGGTAAQSLLGREVRVMRDRGRIFPSAHCERTLVTVHPSALLRAPDETARERNYAEFVADLKLAAEVLRRTHP